MSDPGEKAAPQASRHRRVRPGRLLLLGAAAALFAVVAWRLLMPPFSAHDVQRLTTGAWSAGLLTVVGVLLLAQFLPDGPAWMGRLTEWGLIVVFGCLLVSASWLTWWETSEASRTGLLARASVHDVTPPVGRGKDKPTPIRAASVERALSLRTFMIPLAWLIAAALVAGLVVRFIAKGVDPYLLPLSMFLLGLGFVLMSGIGPDKARLLDNGFFLGIGSTQGRHALLAVAALLAGALAATPRALRLMADHPRVLAVLAAAMVALTFALGSVKGERRLWIDLGGMSVMPIEPAKLLVVCFLAAFGASEARYLVGFRRWGIEWPRLRYALPFVALWAITFGLVVLQKDMGPAFMLFVLFVAFFHVMAGSRVLTGGAILAAVIGGALLYAAGWPDTIRTRIDGWLSPFESSAQVSESLWSVAAGGAFGVGLGQDASHRIPNVQSDFILASLTEQAGLAAALGVLGIFALVMIRATRASLRAQDPFRRYLAFGLSLSLIVQVLLIAGGNSGLLPLTGITLPLVALGGSSLLITAFSMGVLWRLSADAGRASP